MSAESTFVIIGGGLAAAKVAEALRAKDFEGNVLLIGAEERLPYERPPLSKEFLAGKKSLADATTLAASWYRDHHVDLLLGTTVTAIDPEPRRSRCPTAPPAATTSWRWPPVRARAGSICPAPAPTACTTCAPPTTPTRSSRCWAPRNGSR